MYILYGAIWCCFPFPQISPKLMMYHTLRRVINIQQIKNTSFHSTSSFHSKATRSSFWRMKSCLKPSCDPPRAEANVSFLKATENDYTPSLTWQLNVPGSHILRENGASSQTIFWKSLIGLTVELIHLKI